MSPPAPVEQVAAELRRARAERRPVALDDGTLAELGPATARAVAAEVYRATVADRTWKLGALDAESQQRLGLDGPLVAPVLADGLRTAASEVHLSRADFVQPRVEPEVGVLHTGTGLQLLPCVEVADCRLPGWRIPSGWGIADFGLQGSLVFGAPGPPRDVVRVEVVHDGEVREIAERSWAEAVSRLELLPPEARARTPFTVATGGMTPLRDLHPGRWEFRFAGGATLTLVVS